ncbi:SDR family oxidoreductase [Antarcticibacterium sp. 1MA-6-2]|uniref:SDR family oxidoreductase n=1 Tax=Antarcticibacterium sp. 1MA-6-2 TaxID=2908210 RepID=UPI001F256B2E|nr:SDR family oxidoreductase [Antarcticibacterium sp. 1MA-6-2]UJH90711.1 SDR family oxidoreductase [Antarcticibacterium sp. 1MA-6-2]
MDLKLKDKVILVIGGTQGIGGAISRAVAREGGVPLFVGRNPGSGESLEEELREKNLQGAFVQGDLNEIDTSKRVVEEVVQRFGHIYALVNNAGINDGVGLEKGNPASFANSVFNNLNHYYEMAHYCLPHLKISQGNILNISSKVALTGQGGTSGYAAAKGAQLALTREWAAELLPYKIRVNAIMPAEVMTPLYKSWLESFEDSEMKLQEIISKIPLGKRMTKDEEIADLAVFLLSERSSHTTAQFFNPDGGYVHLDRSLT